MKKIFQIDQLTKKIELEKKKNKKIIHCHGVFDLIHVGHIKHFKEAKEIGDFLVVSITSDKYVNKGSGKPIFSENLRAEVLSSLEYIDAVYINHYTTPEKLISLIKPDIYFKGPDYKNTKKDITKNILKEISSVKKYGGRVAYSNDITFSSSSLINQHYDFFTDEQNLFLKNISKKYSFDFIYRKINSLRNLKIMLIGETIIDQYISGEVLGKSGKEPHLVLNQKISDDYLGGAAAIANHLSSFCKKINFISMIGEKKEYLNFIKKKLKKNVYTNFIKKSDSVTIMKKRLIDDVTKNKLLGVYQLNDAPLNSKQELTLTKYIKNKISKSDLILISDYGHGFISENTAKFILSNKKFISLNAQINASNRGYNSLRKYKKIDTLIINENELRHETRDRKINVEELSKKLMKNFSFKRVIITRGNEGALLIKKNQKPIYCPAFAKKVVDKVGAGDAMLAILSLCIKMKLPDDLSLLIGSMAGATSVENIGNSKFINKNELLRQIQYSIK